MAGGNDPDAKLQWWDIYGVVSHIVVLKSNLVFDSIQVFEFTTMAAKSPLRASGLIAVDPASP